MRAERLLPVPVDDIVDVMADAFRGYPVMRFVVGDAGDVAARERRLVDLFVRRRMRRGGPAFGVPDRGNSTGLNLVAAAILTLPVEPDPPSDVAEMTAEAWRVLGDGARERYDAYGAAASTVNVADPHHHLNMIAVRPAHMGKGLARPLIDAVIALAQADPHSAGVSLTTEMPRNVDLYRHFGFEVVGEVDVAPTLHTWGMFYRIR
ncbi:MAG: GNAT family N-acetyltransferase [Acidobacteriota bacterium]|nr:GNAT family N-acetyltransferase [Acidobacteriota bacterium]